LDIRGHFSEVHYEGDDVRVLFGEFYTFDGRCSLGEIVRDRYSLRECKKLPLRCRLGKFCGPTSSATMMSLVPCAVLWCRALPLLRPLTLDRRSDAFY
jgi:hypothetical protein